MQNYRTEFPDFDPATMPPIPSDWEDNSWHNEPCPSFLTGRGHSVYVDYLDQSLREYPDNDMHRFNVISIEDATLDHNLFASDDWDEILKFVANSPAKPGGA